MRPALAALGALFAATGTLLLLWAAARWRLPYNSEGRHFDASEGVVYHLQTAELLAISGVVLLLLGLGSSVAAWRRSSSR